MMTTLMPHWTFTLSEVFWAQDLECTCRLLSAPTSASSRLLPPTVLQPLRPLGVFTQHVWSPDWGRASAGLPATPLAE